MAYRCECFASLNILVFVNINFFQVVVGETDVNNVDLEEFQCSVVVVLGVSIHVLYFLLCVSVEYGYDGLTSVPVIGKFLYINRRDTPF